MQKSSWPVAASPARGLGGAGDNGLRPLSSSARECVLNPRMCVCVHMCPYACPALHGFTPHSPWVLGCRQGTEQWHRRQPPPCPKRS